jgi:hypothetical protein
VKKQGLPKVTIQSLRKMKDEHRKIAMLTSYDATFARLVDQAGIDIISVIRRAWCSPVAPTRCRSPWTR